MRSKPLLKEIPIDLLIRGRYQPRRQFDLQALEELAQSMRASGLLQPLVVRPLNDSRYEIIAGERRWRAAQIAELETVICMVGDYSDEQAAEASAVENLVRVDLNPIEEAQAYKRMIDEFGYLHEEVAAAVSKSRSKVTNTLRLLKLPKKIQDYLIMGSLHEGHGKILAGLPEHLQNRLADKGVSGEWSVRQIEREAKKAQAFSTQKGKIIKADPNLQALKSDLSEYFGCRVEIDFNDGKGQLRIDFHDLEILEGLLEKMQFKQS